MKKILAIAFISAFAFAGVAREDKKETPKTNAACASKTGCKKADKDCSAGCMKSCADRAEKKPDAKK